MMQHQNPNLPAVLADAGGGGDVIEPQQFRPSDADGAIDNPPSRTLWLGGINTVHTEESLWNFFEKFGTLDCIKVLYSKSIAFVNFMTIPNAVAAKQAVTDGPVCGVQLTPGFARHTPPPLIPTHKAGSNFEQEYPSSIVWIGGLQIPPLSEKFLTDLFAGCPGLLSVVVYEDKKIAFINFESIPFAAAARASLLGKPLAGVPVKVLYGRPPTPGPPAIKSWGFIDSPATYPVNPVQQPVDYYSHVDVPDALPEGEVEEFIDLIRSWHPSSPEKLQAATRWVLEREYSIKDIMRLLELRLTDYYLKDNGKRLQALYFAFDLLKTAREDRDYEDLYRVLQKGGYILRLCKLCCWHQTARTCHHITDVYARAWELKLLSKEDFIAVNNFIKTEAEMMQLRIAYHLDTPAAPPLPAGPPPGAPFHTRDGHRGGGLVVQDSDSESSGGRRRKRRR